MKQVEYQGEVMADGHLSLPESVRAELNLQPSTLVQVIISVSEMDHKDVQQAWDQFRQMGKDVVTGQLSDVSENHDRYLYGRKSS